MDTPLNTHVLWLEPEETHQGYGCHAFHPSGIRTLNKETIPVIHHQGLWYTLCHKAGLAYPHLGAEQPDISLYDVPLPTTSTEPEHIEPDPVEQPTSTPESTTSESGSENPADLEDEDLLLAIRLIPLATPNVLRVAPLPLMATTTLASTSAVTQVQITTTTPTAPLSSTAPTTGTMPANTLLSLQRAL